MAPLWLLLLSAPLTLELDVGIGVEPELAVSVQEALALALERHAGERVTVGPARAGEESIHASLYGAPRRLRLLAERLDGRRVRVRHADVEIPKGASLEPYLDHVALRLFPEAPRPAGAEPTQVQVESPGLGVGPVLLVAGGAALVAGMVLGAISLSARAELGAPGDAELEAISARRRGFAFGAGVGLSLGLGLVVGGLLTLD